jgi:alkylation response protein AidB-like acyl-CoA dehydrogenase
MSATEFTTDLRDVEFVLFDQLHVHEVLSSFPRYADYDRDMYLSIVAEADRIAHEIIAPINKIGDREGCRFDGKGTVTTPKGYPEAFKFMSDNGWIGLVADTEWGGTGLPHIMEMAAGELLTGACVAFATYSGLTRGVANLISSFGSPEMKERYVRKLNQGRWAGTMLLTEAGAGSSVGDNRCKAHPTDRPGVYTLEGEKIFISGGEQDLTENIVHVVLARVPNAPPGTKGLSIFIVPKFIPNDDGSLGDRNDIVCVGIEEKMGIHGSATCTMSLGSNQPCFGWRIGDENAGMRIMFHLMNEARIMVGVQGESTAAAAYYNALDFAKERIQGPDIHDVANGWTPSVSILKHPDVRRMLMTMRVLIENMRSLLFTTALRMDLADLSADAEQRERHANFVDLMVPVCKAHCTDCGFDVTRLAMQVMGGYGYCGDYPVEQYLRDNKICSIYEGTNGIQAMDLLGRKLRMKNGVLFMEWLAEFTAELDAAKGKGLDKEVTELEKARDQVGAAAMHLAKFAFDGNFSSAMLHASNFLTALGEVVLGQHALAQAVTARRLLDAGEGERAFLEGKLANLRFYCFNLLPHATTLSRVIRSGDETCLESELFAEV